jgi:hypothetical protein
LNALPQRTTLERAVVEHLCRGRHWRMRTGWLQLAQGFGLACKTWPQINKQ